MLQQSSVGLDARCMLGGGEARTRDVGQPMSIAAVDNGGNMVVLQPLYGIQVSNHGRVRDGFPRRHSTQARRAVRGCGWRQRRRQPAGPGRGRSCGRGALTTRSPLPPTVSHKSRAQSGLAPRRCRKRRRVCRCSTRTRLPIGRALAFAVFPRMRRPAVSGDGGGALLPDRSKLAA